MNGRRDRPTATPMLKEVAMKDATGIQHNPSLLTRA